MKHSFCSKIFSLATAAMLSSCAVPADCIRQITASAQEHEADSMTDVYDNESAVRVVISLKEPALITQFDKDMLGSDEITDYARIIAKQQQRVQEQIMEFYPELDVGASYNVLLNGFACSLPESLFVQVQNLDEVESVDVLPEITLPEMSNAASLSGLTQFMEKTGCTGEGQVVCVIDTELYAYHPMFTALPDDIETKLSKEDVTEIIQSGMLHKELDPERSYLSSKVPYAVDYVDTDPYDSLPDLNSYHGTHVSGIAVGNSFVNSDGRTISGMAPNAQLIFMAVSNGYYVNDEVALQALEDAVVLQADVINMSWGSVMEYYKDNIFARALDAADKAGITICTSAGNSDNGTGSLQRNNYPESPDIATIDHKAEAGSNLFVVASADNNTTYERGILRFEGEDILYLPSVSDNGIPHFLTDTLPVGSYEYVYYDDFNADDLSETNPEDLSGKLMLIEHSSVDTYGVANGASARNAAGILLVHDAAFAAGASAVVCYGTEMPIAFISSEICTRLLKAESRIIENPGSKIEQTAENKISFYTSWGPGNALDLRPDITGIGGSVESAYYDNDTEIMSGTSMSSPYVAGSAAVVRQYLKEQGIELSGSELTRYVRILMMNSAIPFEENGLLVSPRQQGAGLVSLERLMQTKVVMTGAENDAKVNLYDRIGDSFSFDVTLKNISSEDVTFSNAKLCLTTDDTSVDEKSQLTIINGKQSLNCTADLRGLSTVKAGDSCTATVRVTLDPAQTSEIFKVFKYGFFIDGFLMLSGAENSSDISIPICGYYGDWAQIPIYSTDTKMLISEAEGCSSFLALPLREAFPIIERILARASKEEIDQALKNDMLPSLIIKYWTKEEDHLLERGHGDGWISPNGDGMHDSLSCFTFEIKRQAMAHYSILDSDNNVLFENEYKMDPPLNEKGAYIFEKPLTTLPIRKFDYSQLPEGDYKISTDMWINYPDAEKHPQNLEIPFKIDKTPPDMNCSIEQDGDKTYLNINANDTGELDCVFLTAMCADESRRQKGITPLDILDLFSVYSGGSAGSEGITRTNPLTYVLAHMAPQGTPKEHIYNYGEIFPADQENTLEVRYDITGLTDITVTAIDRAWNYNVFEAMKGAGITLKEGLWIDESNGFMEVHGNSMRYADFYDGSIKECSYKISGDDMTITMPDKTIVRSLYYLNGENIEYRQDDMDYLGLMTYYSNELYNKIEDRPFYPVEKAYPLMKEYFEKNTGLHTTGYTYTMESPISWDVVFDTEEDVPLGERMISANLYSGIAFGYNGRFDLFSTPIDEIKPGIYHSEDDPFFLAFNEDHMTGTMFVAETDMFKKAFEFNNRGFSYTIYDEDQIVIRYEDGEVSEGTVSMSDKGLINLFMNPSGTYRLKCLHTDLSLTENFMSKSQTELYISKYHEAVTGQPAVILGSGMTSEGEIVQIFEGEIPYFIDPFTLEGHDDKGRFIDFTDPPELPENARSLDTLAEWALKDFSDKSGRTDCDAIARLTPDGTVEISIFQPYNNDQFYYTDEQLDKTIYTVDPITAKGNDQDQNPIDLPQTGINDFAQKSYMLLALMLILSGFKICFITKKQKKAD